MNYSFSLTCPACGSDVEHVNATPAHAVDVSAVCRCTTCHHEWRVGVTLAPMDLAWRDREFSVGGARCGTESGYTRHRRLREPACRACKDALAAAQRERVQRRALRRVG